MFAQRADREAPATCGDYRDDSHRQPCARRRARRVRHPARCVLGLCADDRGMSLKAGPGAVADAQPPGGCPTGKQTINSMYGTRVAVLAGDFLFAQSSWFLANLDNLEVRAQQRRRRLPGPFGSLSAQPPPWLLGYPPRANLRRPFPPKPRTPRTPPRPLERLAKPTLPPCTPSLPPPPTRSSS